jgi:hypothetical protein
MRQKRVASLLLVVVMLVSVLTPGLGNVFAQVQPALSVVGRIIESSDGTIDNEFFELSLKVEPGAEGFLSAGAVLEYDTSLLQVVDWSGNVIDLSQSTNWIKAMPVPAVGPTQLTGRRAMAYQDATEGVSKAYISLVAEAPQSTALTEQMQNVINVRFRYTDDAAREKIFKDYGIQPSATPEVSPLPSVEPTAEPAPADEPEASPEVSTAPEPTGTPAPAGAEFAAEKVFTLAPDDIAAASEVNQSIWYQADDENTVYYYTTADPADSSLGAHYGTLLTARPAFALTKGESVNSGSGGMTLDQVQVLQFYDWDETFLGARAISASSSNTEVAEVVESFSKLIYDGEYKVDNSTHEDRYVENDEKVLTNKKGYNFGGWVEVTPQTLDTTFTAYATEEEINAAVKDFKKDKLTVSGGAAYIKAAYVGNEKLDTGATGLGASYYTYSDFIYNRIDASTYSAEFTVKRRNSGNEGVTRLKKPVARVTVETSGNQIINTVVNLSGKDEERIQAVVPKGVQKFTITIMDDGKGVSYLSTSPVSEVGSVYPSTQSPTQVVNGKGYVVEGTVVFVDGVMLEAIQELEKGNRLNSWSLAINASIFTDMALSDAVNNQNVGGSATSAALLGIAKNKLILYSTAKGKRALTHDEMLEAINMNTGTKITNPTNPNFVTYMQPKMNDIYEISQKNYGGDMTVIELEDYINDNF